MSRDGINVIEVPIPGLQAILKVFGRGSPKDLAGTPSNAGASEIGGLKTQLRNWQQLVQKKTGILSSCRMPDLLDIWGFAAFEKAKSEKWDLVVSTAGPYSVHAPAYALRRRGIARKWIADWRDLWVDNHIFPGVIGFRTIERALEKRWSRCADVITTVSPPLANLLIKKYGEKVHVIYNGFDADDYTNLPSESIFPNDGVMRIVYTGTIYPKNHDPQSLFRAISELAAEGRIDQNQLQLIFCGRNTDIQLLAAHAGVAPYVRCLGLVPREDALRMQRDADLLLFFEFQSDKVEGILSGKIFEYLFAGPRVLALGGASNSSVSQLLSETRRGISVGSDIQEIKNELLRMKANSRSDIGQLLKKDERLNFYSRCVQSERMLSLIEND